MIIFKNPKKPTVGYGKPPKQHQFTKGKSGNPSGRPKGLKNLATDVALELAEVLVVTEGGKQLKVTKRRAMLKALLSKALKGDARAASIFLGLTPAAEHAEQVAHAAKTMSQTDQDILEAFRTKVTNQLLNDQKK